MAVLGRRAPRAMSAYLRLVYQSAQLVARQGAKQQDDVQEQRMIRNSRTPTSCRGFAPHRGQPAYRHRTVFDSGKVARKLDDVRRTWLSASERTREGI
jgi:hypothetical protein